MSLHLDQNDLEYIREINKQEGRRFIFGAYNMTSVSTLCSGVMISVCGLGLRVDNHAYIFAHF